MKAKKFLSVLLCAAMALGLLSVSALAAPPDLPPGGPDGPGRSRRPRRRAQHPHPGRPRL